ncbi:MAG: hypothetical protein CMO80_00695 [Verrucomicrobiales bacterium]|nr:hypothetical protein [Verrucomicrobiales bacterium]
MALIACAIVQASAQRPPSQSGYRPSTTSSKNEVSIRISGSYRTIFANGIPDHTPGQFPNLGNPHSITPQRHSFRVTAQPKVASRTTPLSMGMSFGVALNGVPFDPGAAEFWRGSRDWQYEAKDGAINLGLDEHNAHVQPTGAYHYHAMPMGLARARYKEDSMVMVGYAADGFPIYARFGFKDANDAKSGTKRVQSSFQLKQGNRPGGPGGKYDGTYVQDWRFVKGSGDLDECNGRFGVTPEYPKGIYHYYITDSFPYIPRQFRGTPNSSFQKRGGPGRGGPGRGGPPGRGGKRPPPRGGPRPF